MINPERPTYDLPANYSVRVSHRIPGGTAATKIPDSIIESFDESPDFVVAPSNPLSRWQKVKMFLTEVFR